MKKLVLILGFLLFASNVMAKNVILEWDHDGECEEYRIYRSQGSNHWPELVGTVDCPTTEFTDENVPHGDLSWVVTAYDSGYEKPESRASNETELAYYYALVKFDYDGSGRVVYKGENDDIDALTSDTDWVITKYYYDGNGRITDMRVRTTSWDNRATGW